MLYEAKQGTKAYEYIKGIVEAELQERVNYKKRIVEAIGSDFDKDIHVLSRLKPWHAVLIAVSW